MEEVESKKEERYRQREKEGEEMNIATKDRKKGNGSNLIENANNCSPFCWLFAQTQLADGNIQWLKQVVTMTDVRYQNYQKISITLLKNKSQKFFKGSLFLYKTNNKKVFFF